MAQRRHLAGGWGEVDEHDRRETELSLQKGFRPVPVYHTQAGVTFWMATEADRSHTTVLLPDGF